MTTAQSQELLPCPICQRRLIKINGGKAWYHEIISGCILKGFMFDDIKVNRDEWNTRHPPTPQGKIEDRHGLYLLIEKWLETFDGKPGSNHICNLVDHILKKKGTL